MCETHLICNLAIRNKLYSNLYKKEHNKKHLSTQNLVTDSAVNATTISHAWLSRQNHCTKLVPHNLRHSTCPSKSLLTGKRQPSMILSCICIRKENGEH